MIDNNNEQKQIFKKMSVIWVKTYDRKVKRPVGKYGGIRRHGE